MGRAAGGNRDRRHAAQQLRCWALTAVCALATQVVVAAPPGVEPAPGATDAAGPLRLATLYGRYLSAGRSDVEIHLAATEGAATTRTRLLPDGRARCDVTGLRHATAGVLVHEVTHCLVAPHIAQLPTGRDDGPGRAADRLLRLASESICDARLLIEVFRADGADAATLLHESMQTYRLRPASLSHDTGPALAAAWQRTREAPATVASDADALAAALQIGPAAALVSLRRQLAAEGHAELADTPEVAQMLAALQTATARVLQAWHAGRHANAAFTWHAAADAVSPADRHVFVGAGGPVLQPTISAEGAHGLAALRAAMAADDGAPAHRLAQRWLLRQGRLDAASLALVRQAFSRFLRSVAADDAAGALAGDALAQAIDAAPRGLALPALLDEALDRVRATQVVAAAKPN